jgi:hypothetical protein
MTMRTITIAAALAMLLGATATAPTAEARGCVRGAIVGGIAGHYAGHHALVGAAAGCLVARHVAKQHDRQAYYAQHNDPRADPRYRH